MPKTRTLEASGHGFYGSIAKSLQKQCKNCPKIHGRTIAPFPLNTPLINTVRVCYFLWVRPDLKCLNLATAAFHHSPRIGQQKRKMHLQKFTVVESMGHKLWQSGFGNPFDPFTHRHLLNSQWRIQRGSPCRPLLFHWYNVFRTRVFKLNAIFMRQKSVMNSNFFHDMGSFKFQAQNAPKPVCGWGCVPDPAGAAYCAPPGEGNIPSLFHSPVASWSCSLRRLDWHLVTFMSEVKSEY